MDEASETKLEFVDGVVYDMAGGSARHGQIAAQITIAVGSRLRGTPCRTFSSDVRSKVSEKGDHVYPDVTVVCGEPQIERMRGESLENAKVVFEVLSLTTAYIDRGRKLDLYQSLPSLTDYVLVEQDPPSSRGTADKRTAGGYMKAYPGPRASSVSRASA